MRGWIGSLLLALGCWGACLAQEQTVRIGSKEFPESRLLAEIVAQHIEANSSYTVERKLGLGGTLICFEALQQGAIDLYPEYTGTGVRALLNSDTVLPATEAAFTWIDQTFQERFELTWLPPFGFSNTYALAVLDSLPVSKISDLQNYPDLRVGFTHEFLHRSDGYPGLTAHYGLELRDVRGMEHGLVYKALENGQIDLTDAYSTDGKLVAYGLKLLEDDRKFFPDYRAAPLVRQDALQRFPELRSLLDQLSGVLDEATMQRLNYRVEVEHEGFALVASSFLTEAGLVSPQEAAKNPTHPLLKQLIRHIELTFWATLLAVLCGLPISMWILGNQRLAGVVLTLTGMIQTIPSLALLGFLIPLLGIGFWPALVALFLYALLPIVRNTYTGLQGIDPVLIEAARAMGMTSRQILVRVRIPLSARFILAGIRTAAVINIGTATLAAFIGAGGLGESILTGITLNDHALILRGAIPAAALALITDLLLGKLETRLEPKGLREAAAS